jgi:hypothetical protein
VERGQRDADFAKPPLMNTLQDAFVEVPFFLGAPVPAPELGPMSRTTESLHVRGVPVGRVIHAIEDHLRAQGAERIFDAQREDAAGSVTNLVRIVVRRDGRWTTFADSRGSGRPAASNLDDWAESLSRALDRSVLAVFTWDGEGYVTATRWKRGRKRGAIATPHAEEDVDDDVPDGPDGQVYVGLLTSVEAIGGGIGMKNPWIDPWSPQPGDLELLFRAPRKGRR